MPHEQSSMFRVHCCASVSYAATAIFGTSSFILRFSLHLSVLPISLNNLHQPFLGRLKTCCAAPHSTHPFLFRCLISVHEPALHSLKWIPLVHAFRLRRLSAVLIALSLHSRASLNIQFTETSESVCCTVAWACVWLLKSHVYMPPKFVLFIRFSAN